MAKYRCVALLPMKANSERVKGKNFRPFAGKPLFQWILDSLLNVNEIDKVIINTDAKNILKENGLEENDKIIIRDRKPEICGDLVSMNLVLEDDVKNVDSETYIMTHTTNPLLTPTTIKGALNKYIEGVKAKSCDSLFTVNKIQTRFYRENMSAINHDPDNLIRTQDLEPWFEENSNLYIFSKESFNKTKARIGKTPTMYEMNKIESVDIDEQQDWDLAELIALNKNKFFN